MIAGCGWGANVAFAGRGAGFGAGHTTTYPKGAIHGMGPGALDYYSLGDGLLRPSPGGPLGMARPPVMPLRDDTPLVESGSFGLYVKGLPGADIRRLGLDGYAGSWAESGLGRSLADMSRDPWPFYVYGQLRILPFDRHRIVLHWSFCTDRHALVVMR